MSVVDGLFAVSLDFGASAFSGDARWLAIETKADAGQSYDALTPRQSLSPVPYALFALSGGTQYAAGAGLTLIGTQFSVQFVAAGPVSGSADLAARSDHTHFAQAWTGNASASGLSVTNQGSGDGVVGTSVDASGVVGTSTNDYGIVGETQHVQSAGMLGIATNNGFGVIGAAQPNNSLPPSERRGIGVVGRAYPQGGGALFGDAAAAGAGIYGETTVFGGSGVRGTSPSGYGVFGVSTTSDGVVGTSVDERGVVGKSTNDYGIIGETQDQNSAGVLGVATDNGFGVIGVATVDTDLAVAAQRGIGVVGRGYNSGDSPPFADEYFRGSGIYGETSFSPTTYTDGVGHAGVAGYGGTGARFRGSYIGMSVEGGVTASGTPTGLHGRGVVAGGHGDGLQGAAIYGYNTETNGYAGYFLGPVLATNFQSSDARLKTSIAPSGGLAEVQRLKPVSFEWIDSVEAGRHQGLLAQDVADVFPELVRPAGSADDPHLAVNYTELIPVLIKAIQEQQAQIEELKHGGASAGSEDAGDIVPAPQATASGATGSGEVSLVSDTTGFALVGALGLFALAVAFHAAVSMRHPRWREYRKGH